MICLDYRPPTVTLYAPQGGSEEFETQLQTFLHRLTKQSWQIIWADGNPDNLPSLAQQQLDAAQERRQQILQTPTMRHAMTLFPDAQIIDIQDKDA